jgi:hypothetical protein
MSYLEHTNITVTDPQKLANLLCTLFDWQIRWAGDAKDGGHTVHVGGENSYLALYTHAAVANATHSTYDTAAAMNHIGVVVDDLAQTETRVRNAGLQPHSHADYEPGRRFYFHTVDDIEIEVVSYQ